MAICWSFVVVLLLTLTALVTPGQPLFQTPPGPHYMDLRDLETSKAATDNQIPLDAPGRSDVEQSWNVLVGRRGRFRRLVERGDRHLACDQQLNCKTSAERERSETREILANYRLPQRKRLAHLDSDRMVPTGPNPLHNSNRSQRYYEFENRWGIC